MTYDPSKKISVSYTPLNLPRLVEFDNNDFIEYTYTATGTKLRKTVTSWKTTTGGTTDYAGQFLYRDNELSCIFTPVGRIVPMQYNDETFWKHEYNLKDHLGNTRIVFAAHPHGQPEVMQQTSYYPFGMTLQQQNFGGALSQPNKLLYNGKELQDDELAGVSLDWYDYGMRMYDAALGRWHVVDPLASDFPSWTPYHFVHNNPIVLIDPTGMSADWYQSEAGNLIWQDKSDETLTINGEKFTNVGKAISVPDIEGNYVNYYENVPISISNIPVDAENKVLNNDGLKGQLLSRNSPLSERSQKELFISSIHKGQQDFLEHPVTKATVNTLLFVATGGIEGVVSIASGGKTAFNIIKNSRPSDWFRTGKTVVSNQIAVGAGTPGATVTWGAKGGGNLAKTGQNMGFHYHLHKYNWYKPWTWFKQTPIIKPPKP